MSRTNHSTNFAARLMLMLAVLQFVFVAFEAAGVIHGVEDNKSHHEIAMNDNADHATASNLNAASDTYQYRCDHCCHCHGHGTHFSLHSSQDVVLIAQMSSQLFPRQNHFQSTYLHTIHRPPIV